MTSAGRILVVDDEEAILALLTRVLGRAFPGHEVAVVPSAEDALSRVAEGGWSLVLTDYRMGRMSGVDLLEAVNARAPDARTVLMTGYNEDTITEEANRRARVDAFVKKPWDNRALVEALRQVLEAGGTRGAGG